MTLVLQRTLNYCISCGKTTEHFGEVCGECGRAEWKEKRNFIYLQGKLHLLQEQKKQIIKQIEEINKEIGEKYPHYVDPR